MSVTKPDLQRMHRLLSCHVWLDVGEWARAVDALAELSDAQIESVATGERPRGRADGPSRPKTSRRGVAGPRR